MTERPSTWLAGEVTSLAYCVAMLRSDGVKLGFTSHDRPVVVDGMTYWPNPGITPSAIVLGRLGDADGMDVAGGLSSGKVSDFDLDIGRWGNARIDVFVCDWSDPPAGRVEVFSGWVDDVRREIEGKGGRFVLEILPHWSLLGRSGPPACAPLCRARLGDRNCGVDMAGRSLDRRVTAQSGAELVLDAPVAEASRLGSGRLRFVTGQLSGVDCDILGSDGTAVTIAGLLPGIDVLSSRVRLTEGCDGRFSTCRDRFANSMSFQGEPHVPGADALMRYDVG